MWAIESDISCKWCSKGYYLVDKFCTPLPAGVDRNCETLDSSNACASCKPGYNFSSTTKACTFAGTKEIDGCSLHSADGATCVQCKYGFMISTDS